jgi:DNA mismatch repair ATPase MutS
MASRKSGTRAPRLVPDISAIRKEIDNFLNTKGDEGTRIGNEKFGIYAFFDYFGEPIYVGQTQEKLRTRIRRHLTNQRTDAVAMRVLDPMEVASLIIWPFNLKGKSKKEINETLARAEYTVYQKLLKGSTLQAILNEKEIGKRQEIELPKSYQARIIPDEIFDRQKHPDLRIARRAAIIADLARIITERDVSPGLRKTLNLQAKRLEWLAAQRLRELSDAIPKEQLGEETGAKAVLGVKEKKPQQ